MMITQVLKVKTKREMMDSNGVIIPEGTLLITESIGGNFNSGVFLLTGRMRVDGLNCDIKLWAYKDDFVPIELISH